MLDRFIQEVQRDLHKAGEKSLKENATPLQGAASLISAGLKSVLKTLAAELEQRDERLRKQASRIAALERRLGGEE